MSGDHCSYPQGKTVYSKTSILIILLTTLSVFLPPSGPETAFAASATVTWNRNQEPDIAGYIIHCSKVQGEYADAEHIKIFDDKTEPIERNHPIDTLDDDTRYYLVLTAFDKSGQESVPSEEISFKTPSAGGTPSANQAPVAMAVANPTHGAAPLSVSFDSASSYDPDGEIVSYSWSFGDGESSESPCPDHVYTQPGTYTSWLTVTDNSGATGATAMDLVITDETPIAINFQPADAETPEGFFADTGQDFDEARGYGWTASGMLFPRDHNSALSPDQEHDTVIYAQPSRVWEMLVPTGTYEVTLCIGSPLYKLYGQSVQVEGEQVIAAQNLTSSQWLEKTATVEITDGRLTIGFDRSSRYIGMNFLIIRPVDDIDSTLVENQASSSASVEMPEPEASLELAVNFQPADAETPEDFLVDTGEDFDEVRGYGWTASGMLFPYDHNSALSPDQEHDTVIYAHQDRVWEAMVPPGTYEVTLCIGSPLYSLYGQSIQVEGEQIIEAQTLPAGHWIEETATVEVADGKLTITFYGATYSTGINYVLITLDPN
jgi:PKD repeat protein